MSFEIYDGPPKFEPKPCLIYETRLFESHRSEWVKSHLGRFVAIQGNEFVGFFPSFEVAFNAGVEKFGVRYAFLVKEILPQDRTHFIGGGLMEMK
jgi:hypothetical protein